MYEIGEKVVYPMHGVGVISKIEEKEVLGEKHLYYILKLSMTDMTVMIPIEKSEELGLRGVVSNEKIDKVFDILKQETPDENDDNWKNRYNTNQTKIKSGSILELAEVVRNLYIRNQKKELSTSEKRLFDNALQLMVDEIALSKNQEKVEVEHMISDILEVNHKDSNNTSWEEK
jgi:CarD family transcriptional regulator